MTQEIEGYSYRNVRYTIVLMTRILIDIYRGDREAGSDVHSQALRDGDMSLHRNEVTAMDHLQGSQSYHRSICILKVSDCMGTHDGI